MKNPFDSRRAGQMFAPGTRLQGRTIIRSLHARGGQLEVYRAFNQHTGPVLVKVPRVPTGATSEAQWRDLIRRFHQYESLLATLRHPAIERLIAVGSAPVPQLGEVPYMEVEALEGSTLADDLAVRRGRETGRPPAEAFAIFEPVLGALAEAHALGFVHRDIKPGNIFLVRGAGGRVVRTVLLDWGLAKVFRGAWRPRSLVLMATPQYVDPEFMQGVEQVPASDNYQAALTLVEVLTDRASLGRLPLGRSPLARRRARTPADFGVDVHGWEAILATCLAHDPSERFVHAGALRQALETELAAMPSAPRAVDPASVATTVAAGTVRPEQATSCSLPPSRTTPITLSSLQRPWWPPVAAAASAVAVLAALYAWPRAEVPRFVAPPQASYAMAVADPTAALARAREGEVHSAEIAARVEATRPPTPTVRRARGRHSSR